MTAAIAAVGTHARRNGLAGLWCLRGSTTGKWSGAAGIRFSRRIIRGNGRNASRCPGVRILGRVRLFWLSRAVICWLVISFAFTTSFALDFELVSALSRQPPPAPSPSSQ